MAIRSNGAVVAELTLESPDGFAHILFSAIEQLLQRAEMSLADVGCFAAASGPGGFTGVRVGLAAVKGLTEALGKRAAGISNLRALACFGRAERRAVVIDARRGEVYGAVYDSALNVVVPETVQPLNSWLESLPVRDYEFICSDDGKLPALASAIALCAEIDWRSGSEQDPAALEANYVRRSDAELFWKDPQ